MVFLILHIKGCNGEYCVCQSEVSVEFSLTAVGWKKFSVFITVIHSVDRKCSTHARVLSTTQHSCTHLLHRLGAAKNEMRYINRWGRRAQKSMQCWHEVPRPHGLTNSLGRSYRSSECITRHEGMSMRFMTSQNAAIFHIGSVSWNIELP